MRTANSSVTWAGAKTTSVASTVTSDPYPVKNMLAGAVQVVVSGSSSLNGTFKLQASCDSGTDPGTGYQNVTGVTNWADVPNASVAVTADGAQGWNLTSIGYRWLRVVWTSTAGTGTAAVTMMVKGHD